VIAAEVFFLPKGTGDPPADPKKPSKPGDPVRVKAPPNKPPSVPALVFDELKAGAKGAELAHRTIYWAPSGVFDLHAASGCEAMPLPPTEKN
jgi:hypothetical protein